MDLKNKTTSEFRTVLDSPLSVSNSQVPLYREMIQVYNNKDYIDIWWKIGDDKCLQHYLQAMFV